MERLWNRHGAVALLVVPDHRDQRAADRQPRSVQRMTEVCPPATRRPVLEIQASSLERLAVGARGDLAVLALPGQPHLEIVALRRGKPHVARAMEDDAIRN